MDAILSFLYKSITYNTKRHSCSLLKALHWCDYFL